MNRKADPRIAAIRKEIRLYYLGLDERQHGGVICDHTLTEIQRILRMQWVPGKEKRKATRR